MRLGQRWPANSPAPSELPQKLKDSIVLVEKELHHNNQDTSSWYWTLTYLENRPVVQLDNGSTLRVTAEGLISVSQED